MNLVLTRTKTDPQATLGSLTVDGKFECFTLEDPDGANDRIPAGSYHVTIDFSNRFQKEMPHVLGSSAIDSRGIRIHCGNTQADTEGCILLGTGQTSTSVTGSHAAFDVFFPKLQAALDRKEHVSIVVV